MVRLIFILVLLAGSSGCERIGGAPLQDEPELTAKETPEPAQIFPARAVPALSAGATSQRANSCTKTPTGIVACPDAATLHDWAVAHHTPEPVESTLAADLDPPDPMPIRDGLVVYDELLQGVARRTRTHLELWANTPTYNARELAVFRAEPELWRSVVTFRSASPAQQIRIVRAAILKRDRKRLQALLFRDGVFYLEDPVVARYAALYVNLGMVFDDDELELHRAGQRFVLRRDKRGRYLFFDPVIDATAALDLLDRVGPPGTLPPILSYRLAELRRTHGLSNIVVDAESDAGRAVTVRFFDGEAFEGALVLGIDDHPTIAVVADPRHLEDTLRRNVGSRSTICSLFEVTDQMARERLEFDEPKVEFGQQDGMLRPRFERAYREGRSTYRFNGVTYDVFDDKGRPLPPQVCVDFVTDAVQRLHGNWWQPRGAPPAPAPTFDIRDYLPFRSIRSLLAVARAHPEIAELTSLPPDRHIPYKRRSEFFDNLWRLRDQIRDGDVLIIYGLRPDERYHFHSAYVRETDPIYGVPIVLTANPGFARVQDWHSVMWESPRRSIQHILRWNPDWLRAPHAVDRATSVVDRAEAIGSSPDIVDDGAGDGRGKSPQ